LALLEDRDFYGCSSSAKDIAKERKELGIYPDRSNFTQY